MVRTFRDTSACITGDTCAALPTPVYGADNTEYGACIIS
jgi:hypothetical protein